MSFSGSPELWSRLQAGDSAALSEATALLYRELRTAARTEMRFERRDHTLQPTGLVHEALLRLQRSQCITAEGSGHFLNIAREVMRHVLKDHAKARHAAKRGVRVDMRPEHSRLSAHSRMLPGEIEEALAGLRQRDPEWERVVRLKHWLGYTWPEIAGLLGITINQARYLERESMAWLRRFLNSNQARRA